MSGFLLVVHLCSWVPEDSRFTRRTQSIYREGSPRQRPGNEATISALLSSPAYGNRVTGVRLMRRLAPPLFLFLFLSTPHQSLSTPPTIVKNTKSKAKPSPRTLLTILLLDTSFLSSLPPSYCDYHHAAIPRAPLLKDLFSALRTLPANTTKWRPPPTTPSAPPASSPSAASATTARLATAA